MPSLFLRIKLKLAFKRLVNRSISVNLYNFAAETLNRELLSTDQRNDGPINHAVAGRQFPNSLTAMCRKIVEKLVLRRLAVPLAVYEYRRNWKFRKVKHGTSWLLVKEQMVAHGRPVQANNVIGYLEAI
jgi:hypothetical protein